MHNVFCARPFKDTRDVYNAVCIDPYSLEFTADRFKTQKMCNEAVHREPYTLRYVPDHLGTQEMCDEAVLIFPNEYNKTKGICSEAVSLMTLRHKGYADAT